ncbi:hypothetical protein ACOSP7_026579 [Xanthoceras sorbifolium]
MQTKQSLMISSRWLAVMAVLTAMLIVLPLVLPPLPPPPPLLLFLPVFLMLLLLFFGFSPPHAPEIAITMV